MTVVVSTANLTSPDHRPASRPLMACICPTRSWIEASSARSSLTDRGPFWRVLPLSAALANEPWKSSTGPRTVEGKARAADNGRSLQAGPVSVRQIKSEMRCELAEVYAIIGQMQAMRGRLAGR